jgi:hypothetical protein
MADVSSIWTWAYKSISASPTKPRRPIAIPPDHIGPSRPPTPAPPRPIGDDIEPQKDYVSIFVNQLFLAQSRKWFTLIEPTVFASTEFLYGGEKRTDPVVIGPKQGQNMPRGGAMALMNTPVFGPHPYRGGPLTFTFILGQIPVANVARDVLDVVEATSRALAPTLGLDVYTKMGGVVLDGFNRLMGLNGMKPVIGLQQTMTPDGARPLRAGYWALIDVDDPDPAQFWVEEGVLKQGRRRETAQPFEDADFLLFQIARSPDGRRSDVDALPINAMWNGALTAASKASDAAWVEAKANFAAMISAISTSPDLLWDHGQALIDDRLKMLVALHKRTLETATAADVPDPRAAVSQRISELLQLR